MDADESNYEPRYLAGVMFFNARDFFEAHEVWEDLWHETTGPDRRFIQALIQAAVCLFHFGNGNVRGASRLYKSSQDYMKPYPDRHWGLDVPGFWKQMEACCGAIIGAGEPPSGARPLTEAIPTITLEPPPSSWPDPESFLPEEES